jgi:hypothetical protein
VAKARSSRNTLKYGVLTAAPILEGIESFEAWETYWQGIFKSTVPVAYSDQMLTNQLATVAWRLSHVVAMKRR